MDIVPAVLVFESSVHLLDSDAAGCVLKVAGVARRASLLAMLQMAGEAAEALVYAGRSAVVSRIHLPRSKRGVALIAECLSLVGADLHRTRSFEHGRQRQVGKSDMVEFASIKKCQRRSSNFLLPAWGRHARIRLCERNPFAVNLMTREAGDSRLLGQFRLRHAPRTLRVDRGDEGTNTTVEVHAVAAEAIVDQHLLLVLRRIQEDVGICCAVPTGVPGCKLLLMTALAASDHRLNVFIPQARFFGNISP